MLKKGMVNWLTSSLFFILTTGMVGTALAETITVGAGAAPTENVFNKIKDPMEKTIGVTLIIISNGPKEALVDLDAGKVDAAAGGLAFPDWMELMEKSGYAVPDKSIYKNRVIGKDMVKVLTHKDVTVTSLSKEQLTGIFTGKTKNWSEVGGPNLPIVVVMGTKIPGTLSVFQKQVMDGAAYLTDGVKTTDAAAMKEKVATTSGAICLGPMSKVDATIHAPKIPVIGRPITLITKGEPAGGVKKMLDYLRDAGQKYIAE